MKTIRTILAFLVLSIFANSCSKDEGSSADTTVPANTLTFKGNPITFNGLSIDEVGQNSIQQYIFTTSSDFSMVLYVKYSATVLPNPSLGTINYTSDAIDYFPVNNYPLVKVRGYINYEDKTFKTQSGKVKITRAATGNQTFEFIDLKFKVGADEQLLNGTINLPKN